MTDLGPIIERELLPFVRQPSQYIGGEINSVRKDWSATPRRLCLAFPDTHAIGISHYGSGILYEIVNARPDWLCERTYLPWIDAQARMAVAGLPLFSWESRHPVREFDILGISLQYELLYSNVLNLLDLAGLPLRSADRGENDPLVLAGGPGTNNPEPMAPFIDLFLIGEAEEALPATLSAYREIKDAEPTLPRRELIARLAARFDFLYAPAFYEPRWHADGRLAEIRRTRPELPEKIVAAHVADFNSAPAPLRPLVSLSEAIHDRLTIEIMRGCPRRCRFCEAGHTKGKLRYRSAEKVLELARAGITATGFEEITLMSLSSSDHPQLKEMIGLLDREFKGRHISLALPSLRSNDQLADLPDLLTGGRKSGLTLVPEAATERLRQAIGKDVDERHLIDAASAAYRRGWLVLKLYFMAGLPGERPEDIDGIIDLALRLAHLRRKIEEVPLTGSDSPKRERRSPGQINISVSPLIPRPHTPLQWLPMREEHYIHAARTRLRELVRRHGCLHLKYHHIERSLLEGVLSRGDRRMADAIEAAYRAGARFDAWDETFNYATWLGAFRRVGLDPAFYAHRGRDADELLPWAHIDMGVGHDQLRRQFEQVQDVLAAEAEDPA